MTTKERISSLITKAEKKVLESWSKNSFVEHAEISEGKFIIELRVMKFDSTQKKKTKRLPIGWEGGLYGYE